MGSHETSQALPATLARQGGDGAVARLLGRPALWLPPLWVAALLFYLPTSLHYDVSWYLVATDRYLGGARLYQDIIEVNPPLSFYLMVPPVLAARMTGVPSGMLFVGYVLLLLALSLALVDRLLRRMSDAAGWARGAPLLATFAALIVLPLPVFGQREHLMLLLAVPYVFLLGNRFADRTCPPALAAIVGVTAALGFGLKPYFVLVPILLELHLIAARRSLFASFRPETWSLFAGLAAGVALSALLNPEYFSFMVPYALLVYDAYSSPVLAVAIRPGVVLLLLPAVTYLLARKAAFADGPSDAFAIAAVGFFAAYLIQSKGWDYHLLPATAAIWLATAHVLVSAMRWRSGAEGARRRRLVSWATAALAVLAAAPLMRGPFHNPFTERLLPVVEKYAAGGAIYAFTSHVWVGFPLVNEAGVGWSSRFPTQWLLPGAQAQLTQARGLDRERERRLREIERYATDAVIADLERLPPDLVIVDTDNPYMRQADFDYLAYFRRDPRFARLWQSYVKVGDVSLEINASPVSAGTMRVFGIWCRKIETRECSTLTGPR